MDQQLKTSTVSFFVTLTYDEQSLIFADDEPCLYKRHLQLHFKRLRKQLEPKTVKYYAVGEYGDRGNRPHYHYLIFYCGLLDRFRLMNLIKESWDFGIVQVLPVNGAQGYVTKYILKFDKREHVVKPFSLISHGLGLDYLSDSVIRYHQENLISYGVKPGGYRVALPRYYKDKIFSPYDRLVLKVRQDLHRREVEIKKANFVDFQFDFGLNPFKEQVENYQNRLYQAMKIYKQKKKL